LAHLVLVDMDIADLLLLERLKVLFRRFLCEGQAPQEQAGLLPRTELTDLPFLMSVLYVPILLRKTCMLELDVLPLLKAKSVNHLADPDLKPINRLNVAR
jgi:hypothetical protein